MQFDVTEWAEQAAAQIQNRVQATLSSNRFCSVMLTGGRSAELLYMSWARLPDFQQITNVHFYFGDERCVHPDHPESNYGLALRTLFQRGFPPHCKVFRMQGESPNVKDAALRYEKVLPESVDILLLGVGEDGHIASLFEGSNALEVINHQVMAVSSPKAPHNRLTITPVYIKRAKSIFVLATGPDKQEVLVKANRAAGDIISFPASLVLNATWLIDTTIIKDI
jgi:6-phosphogluconolactonase